MERFSSRSSLILNLFILQLPVTILLLCMCILEIRTQHLCEMERDQHTFKFNLKLVSIAAPSDYPTFVYVYPRSEHSVYVRWRGISTRSYEESLEGYIVCIRRSNILRILHWNNHVSHKIYLNSQFNIYIFTASP